jgi:hypothetical protein
MEPPATSNDVFSSAISALLSPFGMVAVVLGLALAVGALTSRGWRWGILSFAFWTTTFELSLRDPNLPAVPLWGPLEIILANNRVLATGAMLALVAPSLFANRGWRVRLISAAAISFLALEFVYCGRLFLADLTTRAVGSVGVFLLIFIVLSRGVSSWLQEVVHAVALIRAIALGGVLFITANTVQLLISPANASWNGRLYGTAGNPQHMAMDLAAFLPPILFLMLRKNEPKPIRVCLAGTVGLMAIMLGMTGSRTGAMMVLVTVVVMFRRWFGKFLKLAIIATVFTFLASMIFPDAPIQTDRFTSTENTRSVVWAQLVADFTAHPLIGIIYDEPGIRESSYLSIAARLGMMGVVPLAAMLYLIVRMIRTLRHVRPFLGEYEMLADMTVAGLASLGTGAITEGLLLGTLTVWVFMIYLYLALLTFMMDIASQVAPTDGSNEDSYQTSHEEFYIGAHDL